ncbi:MAG: arginine decarboxylase, pyruvoyl-dependent [Candidatus Omnitrophica bacterium CG02_land_8_20_14_3_00__42_8]|nr:MAG: arginine decarboxylase, pyruvoyl-dependent [Candidatus Omnitrophica bacterium CG02_land_8_20_14_3_00__42_8]PIW68397.1 MAG: arginine decarboxylase, pyruvoyl-dependent [Candidatus Omnitrophica bacterium CG12_big_fil_rev_8_21_14_0_65_42_8]
MNGQQTPQLGKLVPAKVFFTKGVGTHKEELRSYELALRDAGIEKCNLVHVSSIFPPGCKIIPKNEGIKELIPGMITYCVIARCSSNEPRRLIASSVGTAIPADENMYGYMSEHHAYGQTDEFAGDYAEDLAAKMLASTMGFPDFDDSKDWDEIKMVYQVKDKIVKTMNITQSTIIDSNGNWSTVVSAAVFLF